MADRNDYTELIAGFHYEKEKFTQWIFELTEPLRIARERLKSLHEQFDIDLAVGNQLDAVGVRVGIDRKLHQRITDVFFAYDDVDGIGMDRGIWKTPRDDLESIVELGDGVYRELLKAKVRLNHYGGMNRDVDELINGVMKSFGIDQSSYAYVDNQDMSVTLFIDKANIPQVVYELFESGIFRINHAGVGINVRPEIIGYQYLATTDGVLLGTEIGDLMILE